MARWGTVLLVTLLLASPSRGQELATDVFPSEDELREAFENGDLGFEQYFRLREIIIHGVDSTILHLLDEIPNLAFFSQPGDSLSDPLEHDQKHGFLPPARSRDQSSAPVRAEIGYRLYQSLEADELSWYRTSAKLTFREHIHADIKVDRERNGDERIVSRSLEYSARRGLLRRIRFGSFTTRFGLGTVYGYRGKLLDFSEDLGAESFLYPDYGGYNGLLVEGRPGKTKVQALLSMTRDSRHRMASLGGLWQLPNSPLRPGLIIGHNRLFARLSGDKFEYSSVGLIGEHKYKTGYASAEASYQTGSSVAAGAVVVEGRHRFESAEVRYAGWSYANDFIDLTAGSKAGYLSRADTLPTVDFVYRSRRSGQSGLLVKTIVDLSRDFTLANALLVAGRPNDQTRHQLSSSLIRKFNSRLQGQLTYLGRWKRDPVGFPGTDTRHRIRLEGRFRGASVSARCYIGYDIETDEKDHLSFLATLRYLAGEHSKVQVWSDFGEIDSDGLKYWYAYVRGETLLYDGVYVAAKISDRYRYTSDNKHSAQVSFELSAVI